MTVENVCNNNYIMNIELGLVYRMINEVYEYKASNTICRKQWLLGAEAGTR